MKYNIINRLVYESPTVKISEGKEYRINTSKNCVMLFQHKVKMAEKEDNKDSIFDIGIKMFLGEEAFEEIESMQLPIKGWETIYNTIMAALDDVSLEEYEEKNKVKEKTPSGSKK